MSHYLSNTVINNSNISFGTSGARGLVTDFIPEVCAAFTVNFLKITSANFSFDTVAIGIDNRPSSHDMAKACASAIEFMGYKPLYCGVIPTPALAYYALEENIPAIMVTGSHIPFDRNGLKFYLPNGEITKADEAAILKESVSFTLPHTLAVMPVCHNACKKYIDRYTTFFPQNALQGLRIGIYEHSSSGRDIYPQIFSALGADVICLGRSDEFVPVDTEAVTQEDAQLALDWLHRFKLNAVFSTDGDGDRPLLSDENGHWLRGDILGLLCSMHLAIDAAAVPVSCNSIIASSGLIPHVTLTKIGSPYVIASLDSLLHQFKHVAGFEANGGYILASDIQQYGNILKALPTRDALLPALTLLVASKQQNICKQVEKLPERYTSSGRLQNFALARSTALLEELVNDTHSVLNACGLTSTGSLKLDMSDGIRVQMETDDIIHFRASGNAPELRCYAESTSLDKADNLVRVTLAAIKDKF